MNFVPTRIYFAQGAYSGRKENKNARDRASALAGTSRLNLSTLSSVIPPNCRVIDRAEFERSVQDGEVVFAINGLCESNVPGTVVTAGMGIVIPDDRSCGFITELYENPGVSAADMRERIEKATLQIMGDQLTDGQFSQDDLDGMWECGKQAYTINDRSFKLYCQIASTTVNYAGDYACAFVIAVLLP
jgi:arginine decarboxylase